MHHLQGELRIQQGNFLHIILVRIAFHDCNKCLESNNRTDKRKIITKSNF